MLQYKLQYTCLQSLNTRTEGGKTLSPTCLSQITQHKFKVSTHKSKIPFCANLDLLGQKFRSPGQVKVRCAPRDRLQTSRSCCGHGFSPIGNVQSNYSSYYFPIKNNFMSISFKNLTIKTIIHQFSRNFFCNIR